MPKHEEKEQHLSLAETCAKINKSCKGVIIERASDANATEIPRLSTGIFAIDYATGGGVPLGRATGLYGPKSAGKSTLALKIIASAQMYCRLHWVKMKPTGKKLYRCLRCGFRGPEEGSICPECKESHKVESPLVDLGDFEMVCPTCDKHLPLNTVYLDSEGTYENKWAAALGVDCTKVYVSRVEYAEQASDIVDAVLRTGEADLLVIDTLAQLTPRAEITESAEKNQMGVQARTINRLLRKLGSAINNQGMASVTRPTVLILNQVRMKLGVLYGNPETRPGGMGQEFVSSVDIRQWAGKYEKDKPGNTLNAVYNFRVVKSKVCPAQQQGNFRMWLRNVSVDGKTHLIGDTEDNEVVLGMAFNNKVFGEAPKWCWRDNKFKTKEELVQFMLTSPVELADVRASLMGLLLGEIKSDEEAMKTKDVEGDDDAE